MYRIGMDIGSSYTKYCVRDEAGICSLFSEKTPVRQKEYFEKKREELSGRYKAAEVISCGYGRKNAGGMKRISELTALAYGGYDQCPEVGTILDIGGQDTKVITHKEGKLSKFFVNERCAAGSGMFLSGTLHMLNMDYESLDVSQLKKPSVPLSSVCAVFAQSEIVNRIAENVPPGEILQGVLWQILTQAKALLGKVDFDEILLSGGISKIKGMKEFAEHVLERKCRVVENSAYLSAIGCTLADGQAGREPGMCKEIV